MQPSPELAIEAEDLVKHFGEVEALRGVSFATPTGSVLGMLGPNGAGKTTSVHILTTLLEPDAAPASELAALYPQRWELESALDELKTHHRGPRVVLRSKAPDGVYQEAYGHLCTHYAIRRVMHDAALQADLVPHRLSFIASLRAARRSTRTQPGFSPPHDRHRP